MTPAGAVATDARRRFSPEALFVLSAIAQYAGAILAISLFDSVDPTTMAWLRVTGAFFALFLVARPHLRRWTRRELVAAAVFGTATALMNLCFYLAVDRIDLGKGVVLEFIGPIAVAAAFTRTRRNAVALGLAVVGVLVLSGVEIDSEPLGLLFIFLAAGLWATYIVVGQRVASFDRGLAGLTVGMFVGSFVLMPLGLANSDGLWGHPEWILAGMAAGVLSNAIGYGIDQVVLRRIPVRRFAVLLALLPVTAMVMGWLALDQVPSPVDLMGAALVIAGVLVQERDELTPKPVEAFA